jgi:hypothetical protein
MNNKLVLLGIVAVLLIGGGVSYTFMGDGSAMLGGSPRFSMADCKTMDENICKLMLSWQDAQEFSVISTVTMRGQKPQESLYEIDGDRTRMVLKEGGKEMMTTINIGDITYMKDPQDGKWWKVTPEKSAEYKDVIPDTKEFTPDFTEDMKEDTTQYKNLGTEACGSYTCLKYQVIYIEGTDSKEYWWFDIREYRLRKMRVESPDGTVTEMAYTYGGINIGEPSPIKEGSMMDAAMSSSGMSAAESAEMKKMIEDAQNQMQAMPTMEDMNYQDYSPPADTGYDASYDAGYDTGTDGTAGYDSGVQYQE